MLQLDIDATDFVSFRVPRINRPLWVGVTPGEATKPSGFRVAGQAAAVHGRASAPNTHIRQYMRNAQKPSIFWFLT